MTAADLTIGGNNTSVISSSPNTQPRRVSLFDASPYSVPSGASTVHSSSTPGTYYPILIKNFGIVFPATTSTPASGNVVGIYGNGNSTMTTVSTTDISPSFAVSATVSTTKSFDINYYTYTGTTDYNFLYGAGRNDTGTTYMKLTDGSAAGGSTGGVFSGGTLYLKDNLTNWTYNSVNTLRATVKVRTVPSAPTSINVTNLGSGSFRVRWKAPTQNGGVSNDITIDGYRVMTYSYASSSYNVYTAGATSNFSVDGSGYMYQDVYVTSGYNYDVHVSAYNIVSTTLNSAAGIGYYTTYAHTGTNASLSQIYPQVAVGLFLKRSSADALTIDPTRSSYVTAPTGGGSASWNIQQVSGPYYYKSGTASEGTTYDLANAGISIGTYPWSGLLEYKLTATNAGTTATDQDPIPLSSVDAPTSTNLITFTAVQDPYEYGYVNLTLKFSDPSGSRASGPVYARVYDDSGTIIATYTTSAGTTSALQSFNATGYTPNSYHNFTAYVWNNAGYYSSTIYSVKAGNYPEAYGIINVGATDYKTIKVTGGYVSSPPGGGGTSWHISGPGLYYSGYTAEGETTTFGALDITGPWSYNSGVLRYELHATNSSGIDHQDYDPYLTPDAPPIAGNLILSDAAPSSTSGEVDLIYRFSARNAGSGENGDTYFQIIRNNTELVMIDHQLLGTTGATTYITDTGLTPGQTYNYKFYIYNYAGAYMFEVNSKAGVTPPTASIAAYLSGYAISLSYEIVSPAYCGDTVWTITRSDGEIISSGTTPVGSTTSETFLDETVTPGGTYSYTISAKNDSLYSSDFYSFSVTVPAVTLDNYVENIGGTTYSPYTGAQVANTDWVSGVTFSVGHYSGSYNTDTDSFSTQKPINVNYAAVHFRSGGSGTIQLEMDSVANPTNSSRYYQYTSSTNTAPLTLDPDNDTDKILAFTPRNSSGYQVLTFTGVKWYAGFRQVSGASVLFYRAPGDSGTNLVADNTIYKDGVNVNADFGSPASSMYVDFKWRTVPNAPTDISATPSLHDPTTEVTVSWVTPSSNGGAAIAGYRILYRESGGTWESTGKVGGLSTSSYTVTGLSPATDYEFVVAAVNVVSAYHNGSSTGVYSYSYASDHTGTNSDIASATTDVSEVPLGTKVATNHWSISSVSISSGKWIFTTTSSHNLVNKSIVTIEIDANFDDPDAQPSFDGIYYVSTALNSTTFTISCTDEDGGPYVPSSYGVATQWKVTTIKTKKNGSWGESTVVKIFDDGTNTWLDGLPPPVV